MARFSFENGILPLSTRRGVISLLPKRNKDTRKIKNMRGLTLICSDYMIIAKALDNRLHTYLPEIISEDQTGFMKHRHIGVNIRKSLDLIEYTKRTNTPAVIMSVNMEKCFDKIDYSAVLGTLRYFNFGDNFIRWVSLFYNQFQVCTQNFGFLSSFFTKERLVNQGCIISPAIFLLTSEILANKLRNNPSIRGVKVGETEYLLSQFADDMDLCLPYDATVLNSVLDEFTNIETNTGLKVSYDKTSIYRMGSIANSDAKLYTHRKITWANHPINTLGIDLYQNPKELMGNFNQIVNKMETISNIWFYRSLTLVGKIQIVNTLMASLFVYKFQVLPVISDNLKNSPVSG